MKKLITYLIIFLLLVITSTLLTFFHSSLLLLFSLIIDLLIKKDLTVFCFIIFFFLNNFFYIVFLVSFFPHFTSYIYIKTLPFRRIYQYLIKHPLLFLISFLYPLIWGIYFSLSRYIRMGETLNLYNYFSSIHFDWYIIFIFLLPHFFLWFTIFLYFVKSLRTTLWFYTERMLNIFHIECLQYYFYFRCCELVYKTFFIYRDVISGSHGATTYSLKDCNVLRRTISYLYYHPYIFNSIFFLSLVLELLFSKGILYYGVYSLFIYPFFVGLFNCFHQFGCSNFHRDVCLSDYIYWNFTNPHFYHKFWFYVSRAEYYYGFEHNYPLDLLRIVRKTCAVEENISPRIKPFDLFKRTWGRKYIFNGELLKTGASRETYTQSLIIGQPKKWSIRLASNY